MSVQTLIRVKEIVERDKYEENVAAIEPYTGALKLVSEDEFYIPARDFESMLSSLLNIRALEDAQEIVYVAGQRRTSVWRAPLAVLYLARELERKVTLQAGGAFEIMVF